MTARTAAVIGGGPAGLMAAEVLATAGVAVTAYEHKRSVGRKLQLAGRGGLNITHSEDLDIFIARYGNRSEALADALRAFGPADLRAWCEELGETTTVGTSGRVFPASFRATPLLRNWLGRLEQLGVEIQTQCRWVGWGAAATGGPTPLQFTRVGREDTFEVSPDVAVIALGGASWPRVGSDGAWVEPFVAAGVPVVPLAPANCAIDVEWTATMIERFAGVPVKNVAVSMGAAPVRGDIVVTAGGLEGGPVYAHSAAVREAVADDGGCTVGLDLQPDLTVAELGQRLAARRRPKDSMSTWFRRAGLDRVRLALLREVTGNQLPIDPTELARLVKDLPVQARGVAAIDRAISSAGGVAFSGIDSSFMLRDQPGVFVAGEMLDWEAPTGGYLLQATFSTSVAAARGALAWLDLS